MKGRTRAEGKREVRGGEGKGKIWEREGIVGRGRKRRER